jgi:hypothetical protein
MVRRQCGRHQNKDWYNDQDKILLPTPTDIHNAFTSGEEAVCQSYPVSLWPYLTKSGDSR